MLPLSTGRPPLPTRPSRSPSRLGQRVLRKSAAATVLGLALVAPTQAPAIAAPAASPVGTAHTSTPSTLAATAGSLAGASVGAATQVDYAYTLTARKYERRLHHWVNKVRDNRDLRPLRYRACDQGIAGRWTRHLVKTDAFYHQDMGRYMEKCSRTAVGEILAMGGVMPRQMVRMWLASPGHKEQLLKRDYRVLGISARRNSDGAWIGCIDFGRS